MLNSTQTATSGITSYAHDKVGRLTQIDYPGTTPDVDMLYFPNGELKKITTGAGTADPNVWDYALNPENDLTNETLSIDGQTFNLGYSYNNLGQVNSITYPSSLVVAFAKDALGRTTSIPGFVNSAGYHPNGALSSIDYANGQVMALAQNARQLPAQLLTAKGATTLVDMSYVYDLNNNITTITDPTQGNKSLGYDGVNRLKIADGPWGIGNIAYDDDDNIQTKDIGSQILTYSYDAASNRLNSITGAESYTFGYDVYGNVNTNGRNLFTYDDASNLRTSGANSYQYDGHNRRVVVNNASGKQHYVYSNSGKLMHRFKPADEQTTDYIYLAGQLIAKLEHKPDPLEEATAAVIDPVGGSTHTNSVSVTMGTTTVGGVIRYTTDGSTPTSSSTVYAGPVLITSTSTIKAMVFADGMLPSTMTQASYTIQADVPVISHGGATYTQQVSISMSTTTSNAVIRYTTDGTTPTESSTQYTDPFTLNGSATITAITFADGKVTSSTSSQSYSFQAATPTISPNGGYYRHGGGTSYTLSVSLSSASPVPIYYTINGSTPTTSSTQYTGPFSLYGPACSSAGYTVRATAIGAGYNSSSVSSANFTFWGFGKDCQ